MNYLSTLTTQLGAARLRLARRAFAARLAATATAAGVLTAAQTGATTAPAVAAGLLIVAAGVVFTLAAAVRVVDAQDDEFLPLALNASEPGDAAALLNTEIIRVAAALDRQWSRLRLAAALLAVAG